ncbi:MAG: tail fiber domain-containing protein, partial [Saprospiraceae bacterium]
LAVGDNLGNHTAAENIRTNGFWLSNDGGDEGVFVQADGDVGIGTASPDEKLDISGGYINVSNNYGLMTGGFTSRGLFFTDLGTGNSTVIRSASAVYYVADANNNTTDGTSLDGAHLFGSNALTGGDASWTERMRLTSGGNLGIGTTSPDAKLDVENGTVRFSDYGGNTITGTATSILGVEADGDLVEVSTSSLSENIYNTDGTLTTNRAVTQGNFDLNFDANTLVVSGNDNRVGIGTNDPENMLTVGEPISVGSLAYAENSVTIFTDVTNGGNVPAAPEDMLHLVREGIGSQAWGNRASFELSRYENSGTNSRSQLDIKLANTTFTNDNTVLSLRSNGNVGIGTTSPSSTLDVAGRSTTEDFTMTTGAANGRVLQSDAVGNASWVDASTLSVTGDNLGNHTATTNIQLDGNWLSNDGANEGVFVHTDGSVGIGNDSPFDKFVVGDRGISLHDGGRKAIAFNSSFEAGSWQVGGATGGGHGQITLDPLTGNMVFYTSTVNGVISERLSILGSDGNVGIGVPYPDSELEVGGRITTTDFTMTDGASNGYILQSDATGIASWVAPSSLSSGTDNQSIQGLSFSGTTLTVGIEDGSSQTVSLAALSDNQNIQNSSFSGTTLTIGIEGGSSQTVSLAALADNQSIRNLGLSNTTLTVGIEGGSSQTVSLATLKDDLGSHRLSENLQTRGNWISQYGASEGLYVQSGGNVGIGTASPGQRLHVAGNIFATGTITSSDSTLKTNIKRYEIGALAQIQALNPVTYNWKASTQEAGGYSNDAQIGFLAQEVKEVIPEAVSGEEGKGMGIDYNKVVPVVVKAMQEQQETIDAQQQRIDKLEAELQAIKEMLKQ